MVILLSYGCGLPEENTGSEVNGEKKPNRVPDEAFEIIDFAELEYDLDERIALDVAKVKFTESIEGRGRRIPWEEIEGTAYPVYSYDGIRKYYICNIYFGPGDMPSHDEMMRNIKKGYEASKEYNRMRLEGKTREEIPNSIKDDIGLRIGNDPATGERVYGSLVVPASTGIPTGGYSNCIHDFFSNHYKAVDFAEKDYGLTDVEVVGYIWEGNYGYFKLESGDDYYFCPNTSFWMYHKLYTEEEVKDRTKNNAVGRYSKRALELSDEAWRRWTEKAKRYNSGEPVEY